MAKVANKDRAAFRELYRLTSAKLYGTVLRILGDKDLANDVIQECFIKIWDRAGDFDPTIASPITWLATIARNRALDEVRRKPTAALEDHPEIGELAAPMLDPLADKARSEELRRLLACLSALDEEKRQIVLQAYYRGMSREALSKRFDRPVPTIKTLLHRSLAQLRLCLAQ
ncbi:MAG: sigma-70 family RNA polymerase sigma factor [Beijerinckiaceae bacterium]|nr:sigma-70 family RNA polymerase sigma factor [Beijerinckiaceae bacterium]